jgi:hypothetical protein
LSDNTYHKRNPIKRHGDRPADKFVMIPNAVARDPELTTRGARVLLLLLSHVDGYEVSQRSMAEQLECKRTVIDGALQDLVKARYIAVTRYRKHNGQRAYETYHVNVGGKFTDAEIAMYDNVVDLPAPNEDQVVAPNEDHLVAPVGDQWVAPNEDHKEDQLEHKVEDQEENQPVDRFPNHDKRNGYLEDCNKCTWAGSVCTKHEQPELTMDDYTQQLLASTG